MQDVECADVAMEAISENRGQGKEEGRKAYLAQKYTRAMKDTAAMPTAVLAVADDVVERLAGYREFDGGAETVAVVCSLGFVESGH